MNSSCIVPAALTSLSLAIYTTGGPILPDWSFPALRFIKLFKLREIFVPRLLPFFDQHGAQLEGFHLRATHSVFSLPLILSQMPRLQSVVLDGKDLITLRAEERRYFQSIYYLGVQHPRPDGEGEGSYDPIAITVSIGSSYCVSSYQGSRS